MIIMIIMVSCVITVPYKANLKTVDINGISSMIVDNKMLDLMYTNSYEDSIAKFNFIFNNEAIFLSIINKFNKPISIKWDECAYVNQDGKNLRCIHQGIKYTNKSIAQLPTYVSPHGRHNDMLIPESYIYYSTTYNEWKTIPIYVQRAYGKKMADSIREKYIGKKISIMLSIDIGTSIVYMFNFLFE